MGRAGGVLGLIAQLRATLRGTEVGLGRRHRKKRLANVRHRTVTADDRAENAGSRLSFYQRARLRSLTDRIRMQVALHGLRGSRVFI